jgi:uncharacterized protein with GYD domain
MPHYVVLYRFTDEGAKNAQDTVRRAHEATADNEMRGFKVHNLLWTQGQYDLVAVVEAPDEHAMMAGLLSVGAAGNVRSETLRAFTADEMEGILASAAAYWPASDATEARERAI